jgi:hypothetical protein
MHDNYDLGGVFSLISSAASGRSDEGIVFLLHGDLNQMGIQENFLRKQGLDVGRNNVYPGFRTEKEYQNALSLIWNNRVEGWWNYEHEFLSAEICTQKEFNGAFKKN